MTATDDPTAAAGGAPASTDGRTAGRAAAGPIAGNAGHIDGSLGPDAMAWDAFVTAAPLGSYLQLSGWAEVKAVNGWGTTRLLVDGPAGQVGAQVLVRRPRLVPWGFAYAPRGPVATRWSPDLVAAFTAALRRDLPHRLGRISHLRIDPEVELGGPDDSAGALLASLRSEGWQVAPSIQPSSSHVVDLRPTEEALWSDLRRKWRQYVNKARASGIAVVDAGADRLDDFYQVYRETARRAGFPIRTPGAYRDIWNAFGPAGNARLLIAESRAGDPLAVLFLVRCGPRVVEPYGGMTAAGAASRANYLLKWEAIRRSRAAGATSYDMWGMVTPGIANFKAGFGGRDVHYIGAWDLVVERIGRSMYSAAQRGRVWLSRRGRDLGRWRGRATDRAGDELGVGQAGDES